MVLNFRLLLTPAICVFLAAEASAQTFDPQYLEGLDNSRYHHIESENVGRQYHLYVRLPDEYASTGSRYPVIYVLDGGSLFPLFAGYAGYLESGEEMPDSVIVGISYGARDFAGGNFRGTDYTAPSDERDYYGGAKKFHAFLKKELIPFIESEYPADPARRVIFGQSLGGQFVLYSAQTEPGLFWGHIASNPALHRNLGFFLETAPLGPGRTRLFVASATGDDPVYRKPALAWIEHWTSKQVAQWDLEIRHLDGHSHTSAPPTSFRDGLIWLFGAGQ